MNATDRYAISCVGEDGTYIVDSATFLSEVGMALAVLRLKHGPLLGVSVIDRKTRTSFTRAELAELEEE